jgi:hypothetical protein
MTLEAVRAATATAAPPAVPSEREAARVVWNTLPAERWTAALRIFTALGRQKVRVEVTSPEESFTISFGDEPTSQS